MLSVRNVILLALAVCLLSVMAATLALMGPPDSGGVAADSYGTLREGHRGVYELLSEMHVPVQRRIEPPASDLPDDATFVLWAPHADLVANEPSYVQQLIPWIERGGRLVVAVAPSDRGSAFQRARFESREKVGNIFDALKLEGVRTTSTEPRQPDDQDEGLQRSLEELAGLREVRFTMIGPTLTGLFEISKDRVKSLQVPLEEVGGLEVDKFAKDSGTIRYRLPSGKQWTLAARFVRGNGDIIVFGEPLMLTNFSLAKSDNAVLAFDLLANGRSQVVFDEFYHGLSVRGNVLWLLTKSTYALVTFALVVLVGLELWRRAVLLGPPLNAIPPSRRTILEYIDAMAHFLNRSRGSRRYLLSEVRLGSLRRLGERLGLPAASHDVTRISASLEKVSRHDAERFRRAMEQLDAALAAGKSSSESQAVRALQRISRCL